MSNKILTAALTSRSADYSLVAMRVRDAFDNNPAAYEALREAVELVNCLRRLVPYCSVEQIHKAFGAPGDFGYDTPIGDALYKLYRGEAK